VFKKSKLRYEFECRPEYRPIKEISRVDGFLGAQPYSFKQGSDFLLKDDALEWLARDSNLPDDKSIFEVNYSFVNQTALSDINVGSVLRTIVESISREIEFLYEEMESVYDSGFIDRAKGDALDLVVSILGIKRKEPTRASGYVTFIRDTPPAETTNSDVILNDGRDIYDLKVKPVTKISSVTGNLAGKRHTFVLDKDYQLEKDSIKWLEEGESPELKKEFTVEYTAFQVIRIPKGTVVSTLPQRNETELLFETMQDCDVQRTDDGKWEGNSEVMSVQAGTAGNILPGTIKLMPTPVVGVDKVINRSNMAGGAGQEGDDPLRERAKKILDVKGKATLESLRTAIEGIEGIQTTPVLIDMPDGVQGVVRAVIDGGDEEEIQKVIEQTRAAGIKVEYGRPRMVLTDVNAVLLISKEIEDLPKVISSSELIIKNYVSSLGIGESLIVNQLVSLLLSTSGVLDVRTLDIRTGKEKTDTEPGSSSPPTEDRGVTTNIENTVVMLDERLYPRDIKVRVVRQTT
jgi:uncharacterized phage protein gp47/JayE